MIQDQYHHWCSPPSTCVSQLQFSFEFSESKLIYQNSVNLVKKEMINMHANPTSPRNKIGAERLPYYKVVAQVFSLT